VGEHNEDASLWRGQLAEHPRAHQDLKLGAMNTNTIRRSLRGVRSDRPARFDIRDGKPFGNPTHSVAKRDAEDTHREVYIRVPSSHVADKTAHAVLSLKEMQGRIGVAVPVIPNPPASCSPMMDAQPKRLCNLEDGDMLLDPRGVWLVAFV